MKLYTLDKREIRSFRLRYRTLELKSLFENKKSFGLFMMADTLQPNDRINKRKNFIEHNLKITNVSKKIGRFIAKNSEWSSIKNLLSGSVILIRDKNNSPIKPESINFLIKEAKFSVRFLFWNENLYREKIVNNYINTAGKNELISLNHLIKKIALTPLVFSNPFLKRHN